MCSSPTSVCDHGPTRLFRTLTDPTPRSLCGRCHAALTAMGLGLTEIVEPAWLRRSKEGRQRLLGIAA